LHSSSGATLADNAEAMSLVDVQQRVVGSSKHRVLRFRQIRGDPTPPIEP